MKLIPPGAVLLVVHFLFTSSVFAQRLTNRTIDDTNGDSVTGAVPIYTPDSVWDGPSCNGCAILPNRTQTFDGTYHAATYNGGLRNMEIYMNFTGVAIYVFFILANYAGEGITTTTAANFSIDGTFRGTFNHTPSTSTDFEFDALVFAQTGLDNATHTLVISTTGPNDIYVNFDYATYTFHEAAAVTADTFTKTHTLNQTGAIVGVVVGGLAGLTAIGILLAICRRLQRNRRRREELSEYEDKRPPSITPFPVTFPSELPETYPPRTTYYSSSDGQRIVMGSSAYGYYAAEPQPFSPYHDESKIYTSTPSRASSSGRRTATLASTATRTTSLRRHKTTLSDPSASAWSLPILPLPVSPGQAQAKAELRRAHQRELARQGQELEILTSARTSLPTGPGGRIQDDDATQERIRVMEAQIRELQLQRHQATSWAAQDDHELPPEYTLEVMAL